MKGIPLMEEPPLPAIECVPPGSRLRSGGALQAALAFTRDLLELTKLRVSLLVLLTALVGYVMASRHLGAAPDPWIIFHALIGTWLVAAGAAAWNQLVERDRDARMERTRERPLPAGRLAPSTALAIAAAAAVLGLGHLAYRVNLTAASVAAVTFFSYVFLYTPLKPRTHLSTLVGAVPGALPPVLGWAAAGAGLPAPAWILFGILFFWQLPHFLAIAWLYREDYARGGFPLLTVVDPTGSATSRQVIVNTMALICVSLLPGLIRQSGEAYVIAALVLGAAFLAVAVWLAVSRTKLAARAAVLASILYLTFLLLAMVADGAGSS